MGDNIKGNKYEFKDDSSLFKLQQLIVVSKQDNQDETCSNASENNPEESLRQVLLSNNSIIRHYTESGQKVVDLLLLYRFIDKYFIDGISFKYEWYALRRFLEKYELLRDCNNEEFARQMNSNVWFAYAKKSCEANEMNNYSFLNDVQPDRWLAKQLPVGGNATKKGVSKIYTTFNNLELHKEELIGKS